MVNLKKVYIWELGSQSPTERIVPCPQNKDLCGTALQPFSNLAFKESFSVGESLKLAWQHPIERLVHRHRSAGSGPA